MIASIFLFLQILTPQSISDLPRLIYISVFLCVSSLCFSQNPILNDGTLAFDSTSSVIISIHADRFDQSNALTRDFFQKLSFGGYISEDSKQGVAKGLKATNHYGGGMQPGLNLTFLRDSAKYGYTVAYRYTQLSSAQFSDDLFNLIFRGNSYFGSDPANLSDSKFMNQSYQLIDFGLMDQKTGSFLSVGIYDGIKFQNFSTDDAGFLTQYNTISGISYADKVSLTTQNLVIEESENSYSPFKNGFGFGLNGAYNLKTDIGFFSAEIQDIGIIRWNIEQSDTSGTFEFEGMDWNPDLEDTDGNIIAKSQRQSSNPFDKRNQMGSPSGDDFTPLCFSHRLENILPQPRYAIIYSFGYYPELTVSVNRKYGERNVLWFSANAGGYNYFDIGLGTQIQFFERSFLTLGTRNLSGLLLNNGHAESLFVQFLLKI